MQQVEPLCRQLTTEKVDPRQVAARPGEAGNKTEPDRVLGGSERHEIGLGCDVAKLDSNRIGGTK